MPNTIVCKTAFPYLVSPTVILRARRAKLLSHVDHVVTGDLSMVVELVDRSEATPSTKCEGCGSFAQDEKLSVYPTIEVAGLTKRYWIVTLLSLHMPLHCVWRTASRVSALGVLCFYTDRFPKYHNLSCN